MLLSFVPRYIHHYFFVLLIRNRYSLLSSFHFDIIVTPTIGRHVLSINREQVRSNVSMVKLMLQCYLLQKIVTETYLSKEIIKSKGEYHTIP